jgi:hypothetical protein
MYRRRKRTRPVGHIDLRMLGIKRLANAIDAKRPASNAKYTLNPEQRIGLGRGYTKRTEGPSYLCRAGLFNLYDMRKRQIIQNEV